MTLGFTLVELLVVIVIIVILVGIVFTTSRMALRKAGGVKDMGKMRDIYSLIPTYASDHNGLLPGPLFSGQKSMYGQPSSGRLSYYIAEYIGATNAKNNEVIEAMTFSWQKSQASRQAPSFIMPRYIATDGPVSNANRVQPWGYPAINQPLQMAGVISRIDPARQWAMSDLDQLHPDVGNATWKPDIPAEMSHGDYRIAIYFDGHAGKLNVDNEPR